MEISETNSKQMPATHLIQIVPRFPPDIDGLGEFALHLGDALMKRTGVISDFVVWKAAMDSNSGVFRTTHGVERLQSASGEMLSAALDSRAISAESSILLLHYTSYSYSKEGLPWWLPGVLRRYKSRGGRVVSFFHELYAKGRFPNKTWMGSWLQKRIFKEILHLSDAAVTSNEGYLEEMQRTNLHNIPLVLAGIGSNVGELVASVPIEKRKRRLAIFGLWATRMRLYERHLDGIRALVEKLEVEEIADIGSIDGSPPLLMRAKNVLGERMKIYGQLPAEEISALLADSFVGIANYSYSLRLKSGVVAAYQAHGVPAVLFPPLGQTEPGTLSEECLTNTQIFETPQQELFELLTKSSRAGFTDYQLNRSYGAVASRVEPLLIPHAN
jgi:hypothetical protein